jgi:predicted outer membrane repeat protein
MHRSLLARAALVAVCAQAQACVKAPAVFNVTSASTAADLAKAAACPNAVVSAVWHGAIQLQTVVTVGNGTSLTITGANAEAAIDGNGRLQLFDVFGELNLINMTLTNSFTSELNSGAVKLRSSASLTAVSSVFRHNTVTNSTEYDLIIPDSPSGSFSDPFDSEAVPPNVAAGGAVCAEADSNLTISNCTFTNNSAYHQGGAVCSVARASIINSTFTSNVACVGNSVSCAGGGAIGFQGNLSVTDSDFTNNSAGTDYKNLFVSTVLVVPY